MDGGNEAGHAAQFHAFDVMNEIHGSADTQKIFIPLRCECILKSAEPFTMPDMKGPLCFVLPVLVRFVGLVSVSQECCRVGTSWLHQSVVNHWAQGLQSLHFVTMSMLTDVCL